MSPCTEHDTNSPSVVQLPMLSVRAVLAALAEVVCAAAIPQVASNAAAPAATAIRLSMSFSLSERARGLVAYLTRRRCTRLTVRGSRPGYPPPASHRCRLCGEASPLSQAPGRLWSR